MAADNCRLGTSDSLAQPLQGDSNRNGSVRQSPSSCTPVVHRVHDTEPIPAGVLWRDSHESVLDLACGTCMSGHAFHALGFRLLIMSTKPTRASRP